MVTLVFCILFRAMMVALSLAEELLCSAVTLLSRGWLTAAAHISLGGLQRPHSSTASRLTPPHLLRHR